MAFRRLSSHRVPALLAAVLLILAQPAHRASAQKCFPQGPEAMRNQLIMSQVNPGTPEDLFLNPSLQHMVKDWSGAALKAAMAWPKAKACPAPMPGPMDEADLARACEMGPFNAAHKNLLYPPGYFMNNCPGGKGGKKKAPKGKKAAPVKRPKGAKKPKK